MRIKFDLSIVLQLIATNCITLFGLFFFFSKLFDNPIDDVPSLIKMIARYALSIGLVILGVYLIISIIKMHIEDNTIQINLEDMHNKEIRDEMEKLFKEFLDEKLKIGKHES